MFVRLISLLFIMSIQSVYALGTQRIGILFYVDNQLVTATETQSVIRQNLDRWIAESNSYYANSGVNFSMETVRIQFGDITSGGTETNAVNLLNNIGNSTNGFENAFTLADTWGADYIVAIVDQLPGLCGRAMAVNNTSNEVSRTDRAYAVSRYACDSDTFVHEVGHLMGLSHGNRVAACTGNSGHRTSLTPYSRGYGEGDCNTTGNENNDFGTIMVGNWVFQYTTSNTHNPKVPLFSNPNVTNALCGDDDICGNASNADAARALRENRNRYRSHESPDVQVLPYLDGALRNCLYALYNGVEIADLDSLSCNNRDIRSIVGIEQLNRLEDINLANNELVDVFPLLRLSNGVVDTIGLTGNNSAICQELDSLEARFPGKVIRPNQCFDWALMVQ